MRWAGQAVGLVEAAWERIPLAWVQGLERDQEPDRVILRALDPRRGGARPELVSSWKRARSGIAKQQQ